jgi:hypothetical protein
MYSITMIQTTCENRPTTGRCGTRTTSKSREDSSMLPRLSTKVRSELSKCVVLKLFNIRKPASKSCSRTPGYSCPRRPIQAVNLGCYCGAIAPSPVTKEDCMLARVTRSSLFMRKRFLFEPLLLSGLINTWAVDVVNNELLRAALRIVLVVVSMASCKPSHFRFRYESLLFSFALSTSNVRPTISIMGYPACNNLRKLVVVVVAVSIVCDLMSS